MSESVAYPPPPRTIRERSPRSGILAMPRRRGSAAGIVLLILGIWGGIAPLVGPLFGYRADASAAWVVTWDRWWLEMLPGIAVIVGALMLIASADRLSAAIGAWLALAGGAWFAIGTSVAVLWSSPMAMSGPPGTGVVLFLERFGMFFGLGAMIVATSAAICARILVRSRRDEVLLAGAVGGVGGLGDADEIADTRTGLAPVPGDPEYPGDAEYPGEPRYAGEPVEAGYRGAPAAVVGPRNAGDGYGTGEHRHEAGTSLAPPPAEGPPAEGRAPAGVIPDRPPRER